jgi:ribonuclease HI
VQCKFSPTDVNATRGWVQALRAYRLGTHTESLKYRLNNKCTTNQVEQLAILKSLEYIGNTRTTDKTVTIHTDSQRTIDSLLNNIHTHLIDNIRRKVTELTQAEWKIQICWVKAHAGLQGNELADTLAKRAAMDLDIPECYTRIPKSVVKTNLDARSIDKWQRDGSQTTKGQIVKTISRQRLRD